jgi:hypothetical protein
MSSEFPDPDGHTKKPEFERDPFPLMITVCIIISVVLSFIIAGVLILDFSREHERPGDDLPPPEMPAIVSPGNVDVDTDAEATPSQH